jgi:hypothetical protein
MKQRLSLAVLAGALFAALFAMSPSAVEAQSCSSWTYGAWSAYTTTTGSYFSNYKVCSKTEAAWPNRYWSARVWQDSYVFATGWRHAATQREPFLGICVAPPYSTFLRIAVISSVFDFNNGSTTEKVTPGFATGCSTPVGHTVSGSQYITQSKCGVATCTGT